MGENEILKLLFIFFPAERENMSFILKDIYFIYLLNFIYLFIY